MVPLVELRAAKGVPLYKRAQRTRPPLVDVRKEVLLDPFEQTDAHVVVLQVRFPEQTLDERGRL